MTACTELVSPAWPELHAQSRSAADHARERFERDALPQLDFLYRVALRLTCERTLAEDLVQETMLKAFRAWHTFQPGTNVRAWLAAILRRAFITEYRRAKRRADTTPLDLDERLESTLAAKRDPESDFFDRLVDDEVIAAIDALPLEFREPLILSDAEDLKYAEIARIMGLPLGTVKSRIFRARRILRRRLYAYALEAGYGQA